MNRRRVVGCSARCGRSRGNPRWPARRSRERSPAVARVRRLCWCRGARYRRCRPLARELGNRIPDVAQPLSPVLLEAATNKMTHARRRRGGQRRPVGLLLEHRRDGIRGRWRGEWKPSREQLEQDAAERPDVRPSIHVLSTHLFRAHVPDSPHHLTRPCSTPTVLVSTPVVPSSSTRPFARPKSRTFTTPSGVTLMLSGFRSR